MRAQLLPSPFHRMSKAFCPEAVVSALMNTDEPVRLLYSELAPEKSVVRRLTLFPDTVTVPKVPCHPGNERLEPVKSSEIEPHRGASRKTRPICAQSEVPAVAWKD
jgi:hypothetical protein